MTRQWESIVLFSIIAASLPANARADAGLPGVIDVEEHLGSRIPRNIELQDESGTTTTTGDLFDAERPVVLVLAYYRCPMLCPLILNGVTRGLRDAGFVIGNDYRLVTVSIDPEDTPDDARKRKDALRTKVGSEIEMGARFLVGRAEETRALADAVGFRYVFDASTNQYGHPAVVTVLGSSGRISRYLYGPDPSARDLRLAVIEAGEGKIGGVLDRVLITCYRFDPVTRRYGPYIVGFFRLGATVIFIAISIFLGLLWRRERRGNAERGST